MSELNSVTRKLTVWFGKEVPINEVRFVVKYLKGEGYSVNAPFYIGYNLNDSFVMSYLKNSVDVSDGLYLIGEEGSLLREISEYAEEKGKPILRGEVCQL